jgi:2'-5' RNA ligase
MKGEIALLELKSTFNQQIILEAMHTSSKEQYMLQRIRCTNTDKKIKERKRQFKPHMTV